MKSAAFNLAFKVHRKEMTFAEGLLKSAESEVEADFIEALNSLVGETRYNAADLQRLLKEAQRSIHQDTSVPIYDLNETREEVARLTKKRDELTGDIRSIENRVSVLSPTLVPGINSLLLLLVGGVLSLVMILAQLMLLGLLGFIITLIGAAFLYFQDLSTFGKQQDEIKRKKERAQDEIHQIELRIAQLDKEIEEKQKIVKQLQPNQPTEEKPKNPASSPPYNPNSPDLPSLLDL